MIGKIRCELTQLIRYTLVISILIVNVKCQRSLDPDITVYSSSQDGDRLTKKTHIQFTSDKDISMTVIKVDERTQYQKIDGFGATFNEAGMICLNSLNAETQDSVLKLKAHSIITLDWNRFINENRKN